MGWMWTKEYRARQAAFERRRYPTDLTNEEWERITPLLPAPAGRGRPPKADLREVLNAIRYMARSGGGWRMLPVHFDPWQTVYWWFRRLVRRLLFHTIHDIALMLDREQAGREASPSAGVLDSQTVKAPHAPGGGGYDAANQPHRTAYSARRKSLSPFRQSGSLPSQSNLHSHIERVILRPQPFLVSIQQPGSLQGFHVLMNPAVVPAEGLGEDANVLSGVPVDVSQQLKPLGGQYPHHCFPRLKRDMFFANLLVALHPVPS